MSIHESPKKIVKAVCHRDCPSICFIDAEVVDGKLVATKGSKESPVTNGILCPRGMGDPKRVYSKERVLTPHIKTGDGFIPVSWEKALQLAADKLKQTLDQHGNEKVLLYDYPGNQGFITWQYSNRLWRTLGASITDAVLCSGSGHAGIGLHYGLTYGIDFDDTADYPVIIFWGNNIKNSFLHLWINLLEAKKNKGTKFICIDPRNSETAKASDLWLSPRPGSDVALCYGIARCLITQNWVDENFIDLNTEGFDQYKEEVMRWTPERVTKITGIPWDQIEKVSKIIAEQGPTAFLIGLGLNKSNQGAEACRAVSLLPALLGEHRGFHYSDGGGRYVDWDYINGGKLSKVPSKIVPQVTVGDQLENGDFKYVFVQGSNPAMTLPNLKSVRGGLQSEDVFVVVNETHWTETALLADVVLPSPTYREKSDINLSDHHRYVRLSRQAIEPLGDSRHEVWIMRKLAELIGCKDEWLYEDTWDALRVAHEGAFIDGEFDDLFKDKVLRLKPRPNEKYQTPSGKIEFYSTKALEQGLMPLPNQPEHLDDGWFTLLNSALPKWTHSQFRDVYGPMPEIVWINPDDALALSVADGDLVKVYNELGELELKAIVTKDVSRGVLWSPRPLVDKKGTPMNLLAASKPQVIGAGPRFNSIRVKIKP
ncbi:molybdopterin-dependent oxidoreductase [Candidatus Bathyarchaeota archaeon]|nr:molybdopterin-dependent oxidoreductase [Candidatus Bathyarchaeota archaeon]